MSVPPLLKVSMSWKCYDSLQHVGHHTQDPAPEQLTVQSTTHVLLLKSQAPDSPDSAVSHLAESHVLAYAPSLC